MFLIKDAKYSEICPYAHFKHRHLHSSLWKTAVSYTLARLNHTLHSLQSLLLLIILGWSLHSLEQRLGCKRQCVRDKHFPFGSLLLLMQVGSFLQQFLRCMYTFFQLVHMIRRGRQRHRHCPLDCWEKGGISSMESLLSPPSPQLNCHTTYVNFCLDSAAAQGQVSNSLTRPDLTVEVEKNVPNPAQNQMHHW